MLNIFFIALIAVGPRLVSSEDCGNQMENYRQCIKKGLDSHSSSSSKVTKVDRQKLQSDIEQCFLNNRCKSPFMVKDYQDVTKECYQLVHNDSRNELQNCVRHDVQDFVLPQDESGSLEMRQAAVALLLAAKSPYSVCPLWVDKNKLTDCIKSKSTNLETKSKSNDDLCPVRQSCDKEISVACTTKWSSRSVPSICRCVNDNHLNLVQKYKASYVKCMEGKKLKVLSNDPTPYVIESNIKGWCPAANAKNPCANYKPPTKAPTLPPTTRTTTTTTTTRRPPLQVPPKSKFNPEQNNGNTDGSDGGQSPDSVDGGEQLPQTLMPPPVGAAAAADTTTIESTTSTTTTTTEMMTTSTAIPNQDIFSALMTDPVFQNIIGSNPTLAFFTSLFSGKTDLTSIFPSASLLGDFQGGLTNMFGNVGNAGTVG